VVSGALDALFPGEMSLETYNAQYLQRHPTEARAVLGAAKGLQILGSPKDEVEGVLFGTLNPEMDLPLKVSCCRRPQRRVNLMQLSIDCTRRVVILEGCQLITSR
jgi:hypothetical protein